MRTDPKSREFALLDSIMLGGIVFQLFVMVVYVAYGLHWSYKSRREIAESGKKMQYLLYALFAASLCIIARGVSSPPERFCVGLQS